MAGPFKMKGSPMQRNFGLSPAKNKTGKFKPYIEMIKNANKKETIRLIKEKNIEEGKGPRKTSGLGPRA